LKLGKRGGGWVLSKKKSIVKGEIMTAIETGNAVLLVLTYCLEFVN
jgi:hypothetical protein